ncbi:MAG: hypothetical protein HY721_07360 [Planctomycetes bacterium]|nr:hypothetical protein [Planctomycetota bacterium]
MSEVEIRPPPEIQGPSAPNAKWEREYREFLRLKPSLLAKYRGCYVAIHDGKVVESGADQTTVALRAYAKHGYVPMYVGLVSDEPQPRFRLPSPRVYPRTGEA